MKRILIATTILLTTVATTLAQAQQTDSLSLRTVERNSTLIGLRNSVFDNPAMQNVRFKTSLNTLSAGFDYNSATSPTRLEDGNGHNIGYGKIDAYMHKGKATLWGAAGYSNGKIKNIQFNETSDFDIVAPFVMADTVGGNSMREQYHFRGGFSYPVSSRVNIGAEGEYSATMEYRTRDPRPKNLVGNLRGKLGVSLLVDKTNFLGLALTARKYKQTNEIEIYDEVSMPVIYHFTGLGTDYYRFRGDQTETYYKGWGVGGMATWASKDNQGLFASMGGEHMKIDKIISSLNQLPMATLSTNAWNAVIGYSRNSQNTGYGLSAFANWKQKKGTENIFGTAQDNIYPQIAEAEQYCQTIWNAGLNATWQQSENATGYGINAKVAYSKHNEQYADPQREMTANALTASINVLGYTQAGHVLLTAHIAAGYAWAMDSQLTLPSSDVNQTMLAPTTHYFGYLSENRWHSNAGLEAAYNTNKRFMPFVSVDWQYAHYATTQHEQQVVIAVGVKF